MKNYIVVFMVVIGLIGCGSSDSDNFKVTDDGNGTKSPRVAKILIEEYEDGNLAFEDEDNYIYNENNLLVKIEGKDSGYTTTYTYNKYKQLLKRVYVNPPINSIGEYTYSQTLLMNNSGLPVLISRKSESYQMGYLSGAIRNYHYKVNEEGKAVRLEKETSKLKDIDSLEYTEETDEAFYQYNQNGQLTQIVYPNSNYSKSYTYTAFNEIASIYTPNSKTIYTYDKYQQLKSIEWYDKNANEEFELSKKYYYIYENKPYYEAPSSLPKTE